MRALRAVALSQNKRPVSENKLRAQLAPNTALPAEWAQCSRKVADRLPFPVVFNEGSVFVIWWWLVRRPAKTHWRCFSVCGKHKTASLHSTRLAAVLSGGRCLKALRSLLFPFRIRSFYSPTLNFGFYKLSQLKHSSKFSQYVYQIFLDISSLITKQALVDTFCVNHRQSYRLQPDPAHRVFA
jgi:hypothetical protein